MFLKEGVAGHGKLYIIYIRARAKGKKATRSLFYLPPPPKELNFLYNVFIIFFTPPHP
jgi:hypothetical protein